MTPAMHERDTESRLSELNRFLGGMFAQFCCIIPIKSFDRSWSRRGRIALFGAWIAMMAVGWILQTVTT